VKLEGSRTIDIGKFVAAGPIGRLRRHTPCRPAGGKTGIEAVAFRMCFSFSRHISRAVVRTSRPRPI
jgi:hypothetical protein